MVRATFWRPVVTITGWQTTASICFYSIFAGTSLFADTFMLSGTTTGLIITTLMLGYTLWLFPMGALIDAYGERPIMRAALLGLSLTSLGVVIVGSYLALLATVFVIGGLYAAGMPATNRAIVQTVPSARKNLAMGLKQVGVTGGSAISAVLITSFATPGFWDAGYLGIAFATLVITLVFTIVYTGSDGTGTLSMPAPWTVDASVEYVLLLVAGGFLGSAMFTTTGYVVVFGTTHIGASIGVAGLLLATVQVTGSLSRIVSGQVLDWMDRATVIGAPQLLAGYAAAAAGTLVAVTHVTTVPVGGIVFGVLGYTLLGFMGVYYSYLSALVPADQLGEATAGAQTAVNLGAVFAPPVFGYLVDTFSFSVAWTALAGCCVVSTGIFTILALRNTSLSNWAVWRRFYHE